MLRIRFSGEDLGRLRLARESSPWWDVVLSLRTLRGEPAHPQLSRWRQRVLDDCPDVGGIDVVAPLLTSMESDTDLQRTFAQRLPGHQRTLTAAAPVGHDQLLKRIAGYYDLAVRPYAAAISQALRTDWELHSAALFDHGVQELFAGFPPSMLHWQGSTLVGASDHHRDLELTGRGLIMIPSVFCWPHPILAAESATPILIYPASGSARAALDDHCPQPDEQDRLAGLVGPVRAQIIRSPQWPVTTAALAEHLGLARSTVSEHIRVLRRAGLVESTRRRNVVQHRLTDQGRQFRGQG
ncbi:MAG TPA: helix-turn-helix domain-containing protein [Microlunatus sp.]